MRDIVQCQRTGAAGERAGGDTSGAAVKAAGFDDILRVDRDQFSIVKGTVKVHFKPISRDGKTRRWWEAKRTIENMHEVPPAKDQFGRKHKSIFIHAYMILEMEEQDR